MTIVIVTLMQLKMFPLAVFLYFKLKFGITLTDMHLDAIKKR